MAARKRYVPNGIRDDTGVKMPPSGDVADIKRRASELKLHQVCVAPSRYEVTRRYIADRREVANGHGGLITGVAAGTVHAVFHHFVG